MRKYVLIEREDDLALYLSSRGEMDDTIILTPSVFVGEELKKIGIPHEVMGRGRDCHEDMMALDREKGGKVIELCQDIADYLNEKRGYRFKGCHHPDCNLYATKGLLFSIQYRYHLLYRHLRLNANYSNGDLEVYVYGDDHDNDCVQSEQIERTTDFSFFKYEKRSFSAIMRWANKKIVKNVQTGYVCNEAIANSAGMKLRVRPVVKSILESILHHMFDIKNRIKCAGHKIALCDLCYLRWDDLYHADGQRIYKLARNIEEASLIRFMRRNHNKEIIDVVDLVERHVLDVHACRGTFDIHSFHYYPFVKNVLREFIYEEIASLYWAEKRVRRIMKGSNVISAHSDVAFNRSTYAIFQVLRRLHGVETYSYPHGAEGYYDYFWQERLTTSAPTFRIIRSEQQRKHFVTQQEQRYENRYHTSFKIKDLSYLDRRVREMRCGPYYDVLCALDVPARNSMYTVINYPLDYDMYEKQVLIVNCLINIAKRDGILVCIRPKNNNNYEIDRYALNDLPPNVHVARHMSFVNLLDRARCVIMDCPSTVLFESMEKCKKSMCIDICTDDIHDVLKDMINKKGVTYIAGKDVSSYYLNRKIEEFVRA